MFEKPMSHDLNCLSPQALSVSQKSAVGLSCLTTVYSSFVRRNAGLIFDVSAWSGKDGVHQVKNGRRF